jgi:hypothetical protein
MFRPGPERLPVCVIVPAGPYVNISSAARTIELSLAVAFGALGSLVGRTAFGAGENYRYRRSIIHELNSRRH